MRKLKVYKTSITLHRLLINVSDVRFFINNEFEIQNYILLSIKYASCNVGGTTVSNDFQITKCHAIEIYVIISIYMHNK
jgi:hypothetical protein